tara:strand:- start:338 stop:544 length:207 start_codon:yes stop_codon:yes gene_type:complete
LVGWVQKGQGTGLELVVNGPERTVQTFISWIRGGPLRALVEDVQSTSEPREAFFEFSVRQPKPADTEA